MSDKNPISKRKVDTVLISDEKTFNQAIDLIKKKADPVKSLKELNQELYEKYRPGFIRRVLIAARQSWLSVAEYRQDTARQINILIEIARLITNPQDNIMDFLRSIIKGDSTLGRILFAILDILPIPNFQEIFKSVWAKHPELPLNEKLGKVIEKIDWTRTITGIGIAVGIAMGWITPEMILELLP